MLLHGFPLGANQWEPRMRGIPAGWRLITPDLRGFGGSTELDSLSALATTDYADDVVDLLEELSPPLESRAAQCIQRGAERFLG